MLGFAACKEDNGAEGGHNIGCWKELHLYI
jgi:hypothetical protein